MRCTSSQAPTWASTDPWGWCPPPPHPHTLRSTPFPLHIPPLSTSPRTSTLTSSTNTGTTTTPDCPPFKGLSHPIFHTRDLTFLIMHTEESGLNLHTEAFMPTIDPVYVLRSLNYSSIVEACSFEWIRCCRANVEIDSCLSQRRKSKRQISFPRQP